MIKSIFQKLNTREKTLLTTILWVGLLFWITNAMGEVGQSIKDWKRTSTTLENNAKKLARTDIVEQELQTAYSRLDPTKTFNKSKLTENIDTLARSHKLTGPGFRVTPRDSEVFDIVQVHYAELSVTTSIDNLITFDQKLKEKSPYMALEDIRISPKQSRPEELSTKFTIKALELKPGANL